MAALSSASSGVSCELDRVDELADCAALIPAWNPEWSLVSMVSALVERGYGAVIIVDDGSRAESDPVFEEIRRMRPVHLLRHSINMGKGRALKTGINYFLSELNLEAIVTADADGQHAVDDIERVVRKLGEARLQCALGARSFTSDVPLRSRLGNVLTRRIFRLATGIKLADTQTGLRAFSREVLPDLLRLDGEGYEYEINVLARFCRKGTAPAEVPIKTIYIDGNRSSHFDPVRDSLKIYLVLFKVTLSSIFSLSY